MLRLKCILSRILTGYGPRLLSQPFSFVPTLDIIICYSHLAQFEPLHDCHSPFRSFSNTRTFGVLKIFHPSSWILKKISTFMPSCIFIWVLPIFRHSHSTCFAHSSYSSWLIFVTLVVLRNPSYSSPFVVPVLIIHPRHTRPSPWHSF